MIISPQNFAKGASLRFDSTNASSFYLRREASSREITSTLEVSPLSNPVH